MHVDGAAMHARTLRPCKIRIFHTWPPKCLNAVLLLCIVCRHVFCPLFALLADGREIMINELDALTMLFNHIRHAVFMVIHKFMVYMILPAAKPYFRSFGIGI